MHSMNASELTPSTMADPEMDPGQQMFTTVFSLILSSVGSVTNTLSLSYFTNIANKSLGDRILILLNSLDLSVCFLTLVDVIYRTWLKFYNDQITVYKIEAVLDAVYYFVFTESTGFATCLLSLTRAISLCFPFYSINPVAVTYGTILYFVFLILKQSILLGLQMSTYSSWEEEFDEKFGDVSKIITFFTMIIFVVIVLISNSLTGYKLVFSRDEAINQGTNTRRAGITVFILSSLFLFFNLLYIAVGGIMIVFSDAVNSFHPNDLRTFLMQTVMQFSVPINSACNPIVYFCRKARMRAYIKSIWSKCFRLQTVPCSREDGNNPQGPSTSHI